MRERLAIKEKKAALLPRTWPLSITYLKTPIYSRGLVHDQLKGIRTSCTSSSSARLERPLSGPSPHVLISQITSEAHPVSGQYGLFATQHLPPDTFILQYLGYVHGAPDTNESSDFDLKLDRDLSISVDAACMGNEARFVNDYRGVRAGGPNAEFRDCWVAIGQGLVERRIGIYVLTVGKCGKRGKGIANGEEILVNYGKGFWEQRRQKY